MAKQQLHNVEVIPVGASGLHTDNAPVSQPKGTYRFALNAVIEASDGQHGFISNEKANVACTNKPSGAEFIGDAYLEDDTSVAILTNIFNGRTYIGLVEKDNKYKAIVDTTVLDCDIAHQCEITYRLRRGKERVIYWVDGKNRARTFNLDREYNFYTAAYQSYLRSGGNPNTYVLEKWDASSFDLVKSFRSIPSFSDIEITENGSILPGSYNFAVQYVDEDLNPTEWINVSNTVNIFNDSLNNPYQRIRGSRNTQNNLQNFTRANKSIRLTITNLDVNFPFYRVAIIRATGNTGVPVDALASDIYSTSDSNFVYSGNDANLVKVALGDILIDEEIIFAPQHIDQLENRLLLANGRGKSINWCEFQTYASRIASDVCYKDVILNSTLSDPNVKNAKSTFVFRGYMPGEVYSFGISYLFDDGTLSPSFHIPGKALTNLASDMKGYELDSRYQDIHNCSTNNYWDKDSEGNTLVGKKQRHHRFPFRKDVNKPLVTTVTGTTTITKYRLKVKFELNPAWTPGPNEYPTDGGGDPELISYTINYQMTGNPTVNAFNGVLADDTDLGLDVVIYDDTVALDIIDPPEYGELDAASELATVYQIALNERFLLTFTYESYVADSVVNADTSQIFGIEFSGIERPHPNVVGFYIVRNERLDDDKLILDNAIFGGMTKFNQYRSFGLIMPKQYYHVSNCGRQADAGKTLLYDDKASWFWNPDFQFLQKKHEFSSIEVEGKYTEDVVTMPTISNWDGSACNGGDGTVDLNQGSKGVYIDDVQAGTSYNGDFHKKKDKDDDGFDLVIGYRNTTLTYAIENSFIFPVKKKIFYHMAAAYQNYEGNTYYNVSVDNKIGMYITDSAMSSNIYYDSGTTKNALIYAALKREITSAYSNYITRPYYKEHNNPIMFGTDDTLDGIQIFNGDVQISGFNFVSSVFYDMVVADRAKKSRVWKIVAGAILIIAAAVATIYSLGVATPLLVAALGFGASLLSSGIKFEQMKSMIDTDYEKGLKETVVDGGVFETIRDTIQKEDDTIRWFSDRVSNIYLETNVPFGIRAGLTCGVTDFTDAPAPYDEPNFRTYLTEKLTILDREQGSGRVYKGYAAAEWYDINLDYMRFNKEKVFTHLPVEYDCCADDNEDFPMRIWYSQQSFQEEKVDNYRVFLPNNYRDIEGEHGEITDLYRLGNSLFIHTREGLWHLPQNVQERITNEIVSFIGTGEFFNIPPRKVIDDELGSGGTQHKWATVKTRNGVAFLNEVEGKIYLHADKVTDISLKGMRNWFENNIKGNLTQQLFVKFGVTYPYANNPANPNGVGYHSTYDARFERILFTKKDYAILPEKLAVLQLVALKPVIANGFVYAIEDGKFYEGLSEVYFDNQTYFENKSWTLSFSFHTQAWVSWHSYMPNYYIHNQNNLYSSVAGDPNVYKHNIDGKYQTFYNNYKPFIIEIVKNNTPLMDTVTEDLTLQTEAKIFDEATKQYRDARFITFNKMTAYNSLQSSGEQSMKVKDDAANPENWYEQQLANAAGEILITRKERNWNINEFRDYIVNYDVPMFSSAWNDIKAQYFIDKVQNGSALSYFKPWSELQNFRDKFIVFRLKFDTFDNVNLALNYAIETEQPSIR